jgi:recombination protein RecA
MKKEKIDKGSISELLKKINDEFGPGSVTTLDTAPHVDVDVVSTGSFSLDRAIGVGGFPRGRIIEIFGPESSGKTTLALSVIAQSQKDGGRAVYIDVENAMDPVYAKNIGVDTKQLILSQPDGGEEALRLVERFLKEKTIDVIVIDSVAALVPKVEQEGEIGQANIGSQARLMSQALRKLTGLAKEANAIVIFINQIRMKVGVTGYQNPETTPGGRALGFYSSVRLDIRRIAKIIDGEEVIGNNVKVKVVKNKVAAPFKTCEFMIKFNQGIDFISDVFNVAVKNKVITKEGNTYYYNNSKLGVGMKNATTEIIEKKEILQEIIKKISI